jgi:O-antigen ligase
MLYFFIVFDVLREYFAADAERRKLFKLFEAFALLQTATLVIGFIFNIKILSAYLNRIGEITRFGYQGFIPAQNEVSLFFIIAFFYFLAKWHYGEGNVLLLFGVFISALLTGTRTSLAVIPSLVFYAGWAGWRSFLRGRGYSRYIYVIMGILILAGLVLWQQEYILKRIAPTLNYFSYQLRNKGYVSDYEMVAGLFSGRIYKLQTFFQAYLPRFSWANYLVGGYDVTSYAVEMDFVDVFARLGIIGAILFYGNYLRCLFYPARLRVNFIHILFVAVWLGIAALAGHVVSSAINASYLSILLLAFVHFLSPPVSKIAIRR